MTEQELNVFLDLEWNCAAFTPETEHISAPLSPKQWARIISRHFKSFVHSPSLPRTSGSSFLKSSHRLHGGAPAGKISPLLNGSGYYDTNRLCTITARYLIIRLYGVGYWQVTGVMQGISTHMISLWEIGSGSSSIIRARGFNVPAGNSSRNLCGGASFTVPLNC